MDRVSISAPPLLASYAVRAPEGWKASIDVLSTLSTALVIGYGGWQVIEERLSIGLLAAFLLYVQHFFRPVQLAASVWTQIQSALAGSRNPSRNPAKKAPEGFLRSANESPVDQRAVTVLSAPPLRRENSIFTWISVATGSPSFMAGL